MTGTSKIGGHARQTGRVIADQIKRMRSSPLAPRPLLLLANLLLATLGVGCRIIQRAADVPGQAVRAVTPGQTAANAVDPAEMQAALIRFAADLDAGIGSGIEKLRRGTNALDRAEILKWKIAFGNKTSAIVSGPNAVANLLDMAVFVSITRAALAEHWQPEVFGVSGQPMLKCCQNAETNVWRLVDKVLKPEQQVELRASIAAWCRQNEMSDNLLAASVADFVTPVAPAGKAEPVRTSGLFDLLNLDPLAGLDPATREIAQTRLFAQRALYLTQKMPQLLRWQMELYSLNAVGMPAVQQLVTNSTQLAASVDRFARVAEQLPEHVGAERAEILKALQAQERDLAPLIEKARETLVAGSQMSASLNTTLTTFDALMKRFGINEPNSRASTGTNGAPFRILDYADTGAQLEATARQLTELLRTFDQTLGSTNITQLAAHIRPVVQQAQSGGRELVDYAFWKGVLFVAIVFVAALLYRLIAACLLHSR